MSPKSRTSVPKPTRDKVLADFRHRCAICGGDRPQLHHIDEDPSNHDELNLLPLCPNCHLTDLHDPTQLMDPRRLRLFRVFRDPLILRPQFLPLFRRLVFLYDVEGTSLADQHASRKELVEFVRALNMGEFYAGQIEALLKPRARAYAFRTDGGPDPEYERARAAAEEEDRRRIVDAASQVRKLAVELLRYQDWPHSAGSGTSSV